MLKKMNLYSIIEDIEKLKLKKIMFLLKKKNIILETIKKEKLILIQYQSEYINNFKFKKSIGINEIEWKNYSFFLDLLNKNILIKEKKIKNKGKEIKNIIVSCKKKFKKINMYKFLNNIFYKKEKSKEMFLNQRILDELMILFCLK
ncbi:Flagellar FliJ protein [Buchnera aphidicola (Tetraneura ulmi)]|uniref:hypothetical protein n=1 Tax=Buchnera aphidicola TaxID=9 RepID=UPI003463CB4E